MTLRTAVVGGGTVSTVHLTGIQQNPRTELAGVCDIDEDVARDLAAEYDTRPFFDLSEMIAEVDLDWIHLCTPVQTHLDLATTAIEAGIPVQIEKPITETYAEFERLAEVATAHGVAVSEVHNHVFDPAMRVAMAREAEGRLGDVKGVNLVYTGSSRPDDPNRGPWNFDLAGGEFEEGLPHPLYLTLRAGGYPRDADAVRATTSLYGEYERSFDYDGAQVQYVTADDVLCSTTVLGGTVPNRVLLVHGTDASLTVDFVSQTVEVHDRDYKASSAARALNNLDRAGDRLAGTVANARGVLQRLRNDDWDTERSLNGHYYQFDAEARALETGGEMPVPLEEARWTVRLMEAVRDDARAERATQSGPAPTLGADGE
jgi:predicted dehydrogenase